MKTIAAIATALALYAGSAQAANDPVVTAMTSCSFKAAFTQIKLAHQFDMKAIGAVIAASCYPNIQAVEAKYGSDEAGKLMGRIGGKLVDMHAHGEI